MAECRDLEEVVYGPEGDQERNLLSALKDTLQQAGKLELERLRIECRVQPSGTGRSRSEWNRYVRISDPPELIRDALYHALADAPGEGFSGQIRLRFIDPGDSQHRIGGYTRTLRPGLALSPADLDPSVYNGTGSLRGHFDDACRPSLEMALRFADKNLAMAQIMASTWQATMTGAPLAREEDPSLLSHVVQGALSIATAANEQDRATAAAQTMVQAATYVPPPPSAGVRRRSLAPPPSPLHPPWLVDRGPPLPRRSPGRDITESEVRKWATEHPEAAERLVKEALLQGGKLG